MTLSIFLVEDDPELRASLTLVLEALDTPAIVATADSEQAASTWLRRRRGAWDLMVLDLTLAAGSGFGVLQDMQPGDDRTRVMVLTNSPTPLNRARCRQLGVVAVFDKIFDMSDFVDHCNAVAATRAMGA